MAEEVSKTTPEATEEATEAKTSSLVHMEAGVDMEKLASALLRTDNFELTIDPEVQRKAIVAELLEATNLEDVFGEIDVVSSEEAVDRPFILERISWHEARLPGGPPVFASIHGRWVENGNRCIINTSSAGILAQLLAGAKLGLKPGVKLVVRRSERPTASGFHPLRLRFA